MKKVEWTWNLANEETMVKQGARNCSKKMNHEPGVPMGEQRSQSGQSGWE